MGASAGIAMVSIQMVLPSPAIGIPKSTPLARLGGGAPGLGHVAAVAQGETEIPVHQLGHRLGLELADMGLDPLEQGQGRLQIVRLAASGIPPKIVRTTASISSGESMTEMPQSANFAASSGLKSMSRLLTGASGILCRMASALMVSPMVPPGGGTTASFAWG